MNQDNQRMVTLLTKPINIKKNLAEGASLFFFVGSLIFTKAPEVCGLESEQITSELNTIKSQIGHLLYAQGETQKTLTQLNKKIKDLEEELENPRFTSDQWKEIKIAQINADKERHIQCSKERSQSDYYFYLFGSLTLGVPLTLFSIACILWAYHGHGIINIGGNISGK